jgi:hypothetical protein
MSQKINLQYLPGSGQALVCLRKLVLTCLRKPVLACLRKPVLTWLKMEAQLS